MPLDRIASYLHEILSRDSDRIQKEFAKLSVKEKENTVEHLIKIFTQDDWHPAQIQSAMIDLRAIENIGKSSHEKNQNQHQHIWKQRKNKP